MGNVRTTLTRSNGNRMRLQDIELPNISDLVIYLLDAKPSDPEPKPGTKNIWAKNCGKLYHLAEDMLAQLRGPEDIDNGPS